MLIRYITFHKNHIFISFHHAMCDGRENFPENTYAKAFLTEASKMGLLAKCSDAIAYITPKDHTANTNFIKSLIRFFSTPR